MQCVKSNHLEDSTFIDNNPSLCIPRVNANIQLSFISEIFQKKLNLGKIKKIYFYPCADNSFKKVFIYFDYWNNHDFSNEVKQEINNGTVLKIVYSHPWFWKCSINKKKKNESV
tara:strand:- start:2827 stop:3168 length:342 start_codon:yes stop_codon:yes gene_type:complete